MTKLKDYFFVDEDGMDAIRYIFIVPGFVPDRADPLDEAAKYALRDYELTAGDVDPKAAKVFLVGRTYDDNRQPKRFEDGKAIFTSYVKSVSEDLKTVQTKNSEYTLEEPYKHPPLDATNAD
ncbi:hypothetical protein FWF93_03135 [Candidatus Saccharibacteria bacterium]|jgi:hypothetical protein|nr:hypothetical protein [Candidatus Saccharibacteria bacterium]